MLRLSLQDERVAESQQSIEHRDQVVAGQLSRIESMATQIRARCALLGVSTCWELFRRIRR